MFRELRTSLSLFVILFVVTGFLYPMITLKTGQILFPFEAEGSIVANDGTAVGSSLIGQNFTKDIYFHGRPSAAGTGYDASNSSGSNLATTSPDLQKTLQDRIAALRTLDATTPIPVDLVTSSGSGLDPDISVAAAKFQAAHVALSRHLDVTQINSLISQYTESKTFGILGEDRVNVLAINRALDQLAPQSK